MVPSTSTPAMLRMPRISKTLSVLPSARIDTAITVNDSSTPNIHNSRWPMLRSLAIAPTRAAGGSSAGPDEGSSEIALLRVRLVFRTGPLEGGKLLARRVDRHDFGILVERHLEAPGVEHLWNPTDVRDGHRAAHRIRRGLDHRFDRIEADDDPMVIPGVDRGLIVAERVFQLFERRDVTDRLDIV